MLLTTKNTKIAKVNASFTTTNTKITKSVVLGLKALRALRALRGCIHRVFSPLRGVNLRIIVAHGDPLPCDLRLPAR
jgi:hypothetical protein